MAEIVGKITLSESEKKRWQKGKKKKPEFHAPMSFDCFTSRHLEKKKASKAHNTP